MKVAIALLAFSIGLAVAEIIEQKPIIEQRPIDWSSMLQKPSGGWPTRNKNEGDYCRFTSDCLTGCCAGLSSRTCQAHGNAGATCSNFQIKGGAYPRGCPCANGLQCVNGKCTGS